MTLVLTPYSSLLANKQAPGTGELRIGELANWIKGNTAIPSLIGACGTIEHARNKTNPVGQRQKRGKDDTAPVCIQLVQIKRGRTNCW